MPIDVPLLKEKIVTSILFAAVETDLGVTGYGLTRGSQRFGMREFINRELAPFLRGKNPEVAKQLVAQGETRLKMVVAVEPENPKLDAERVRAVRHAVGDEVELMIDANYLFSFNRALELCKLVEPVGITWFEEPVYQNDAALLADLRRHTSIPLAAGQNEGHRFRHRELIVNHAVDIAQPNVCSVGGYTEAVKVAALAQAFNLPIANGGGWPHHNMHLQAAMANVGASSFTLKCGASATRSTRNRQRRITAG